MPERVSPESRVLINGSALPPDLRADVLDITVTQHVEGGDSFQVVINTLASSNQRLKWNDSTLLAPGNGIEIQLGYPGQLETMVVGEITGLRAEFPATEAATMTVLGFDKLHRLRRGRRVRVFQQMKDSQVAEQVARDLGLTPDVQDSSVVHRYLLQANQSDIDFLLERARRIWFEVQVVDGKLRFRRSATQAATVATLTYMQDLKGLVARLSTAQQISQVHVRGWDPAGKSAIVGIGQSGDEPSRMGGTTLGPVLTEQAFGQRQTVVSDVPIESQAEADQIARGRFNDIALEWLLVEGEAVGNTAVRAGSTVRLDGLGRRFSGTYYVRKAEHRLSPALGYVTQFSGVRNAS